MNDSIRLITYVVVMAGVTYLIRMIPLALFRKKLNNRFIQSFLFYVPYAVLAAMTFPAIFSATDYAISAVLGCLTAIILSLKNKGLLTVSLVSSLTVFIVEWIINLIK